MARGRMLNQSIAEDVEFNEMSIEAQLMFLRTVPFLDRDGLINGNASVLRGKVAPLLDLPKSMASIVDEWINAGLIVRYTAGKQTILFFPGFAKNQIGMRYDREAASTYPPPPGYTRTAKGLVAPGEKEPQHAPIDDSDNGENGAKPNGEQTPDECRSSAGVVPDELPLNGMEWNIKRKELQLQEKAAAEVAAQGSGGSGGSLPRAENQDYADICSAVEQNGFGFLTEIMADQITDMLKEYPKPWILDAMKVAVSQNKRKLSYVSGVLTKWKADGRDSKQAPAAPANRKPERYIIKGGLYGTEDREITL